MLFVYAVQMQINADKYTHEDRELMILMKEIKVQIVLNDTYMIQKEEKQIYNLHIIQMSRSNAW